jgi:exodeoxyribonuclease VII large subunit
MNQPPLFSPPVWTVTDLTRYLKDIFESDTLLQDIWVQGEISNLSRPQSGHLYFTIKDGASALRCVMWRTSAARLRIPLRDGQSVEVHGGLSIYEASGQYQLYADLLRPAGEGALYQEFLRLKAALEAEGLFDSERKRPIPRWPRRIGLVTSPTGAALQDMLNTLRRRYPLTEVVLAPTAVQGDEAPGGVISALQALNRCPNVDVIIVARGGGSIEDLWAFNDERVARAICSSAVPVITGVGHETDFTIADFVSDLRAPTPTAAAELASPDRQDLLAATAALTSRLERRMQTIVTERRWELAHLQNRFQSRSPVSQVRTQRQRVDELSRRLTILAAHNLQMHRARLTGIENRLTSLSPLSVLKRGYSILTLPDGRLLTHAAQAASGDVISAHLQDGSLKAQVIDP